MKYKNVLDRTFIGYNIVGLGLFISVKKQDKDSNITEVVASRKLSKNEILQYCVAFIKNILEDQKSNKIILSIGKYNYTIEKSEKKAEGKEE